MSKKPIFSVEVFPPKIEYGIERIYGCLEGLSKTNPAFISVTYSAGNATDGLTAEVCGYIKNKYNLKAVSHLTCTGATKAKILSVLDKLKENGVTEILALRGDITPEKPLLEYQYATELMETINEYGGFELSASCYPEGHVESKDRYDDIIVMKKKYDLGVRHYLSQLFFDNLDFMYMVEEARKLGVKDACIEAGIMPVTRAGQIKRMVELSGAKLTDNIVNAIEKYGNNKDDMYKAGIEMAIEQIRDLIDKGVDGIHLYTMDDEVLSQKIYEGIKDLL